MAFQVELIHGRPLFVYQYVRDEEGNCYWQKGQSIKDGSPDFQIFMVNMTLWPKLLNLAKEHDWKPLGTILIKDKQTNPTITISDYEPDWPEFKNVLAQDAYNMALAIEKAIANDITMEDIWTGHRPVLIIEGMDEKAFAQANATEPSYLSDLVRFLKKGEFIFSYDD